MAEEGSAWGGNGIARPHEHHGGPAQRLRFAASRDALAGALDAAILDVNLGQEKIYPIAQELAERGIPFVFMTSYGPESLDRRFRQYPILQKPIVRDALAQVIENLAHPYVRSRRMTGSPSAPSGTLAAYQRCPRLAGAKRFSMDQAVTADDDAGRYRRLIEAVTHHAIYMLGPVGIVTSWNANAARDMGQTRTARWRK